MPDPVVNDQDVKTDPPADDQGVNTDAVNKDDKNDPRNNPLYGRVQELSAKNKKLADDMTKIEDDRAKVRKAELEKQGEYKTLLEEADARVATLTTERDSAVTKWDTYETSQREALTADLSEEDKALAMKLDLVDMTSFVTRITGDKKIIGTDNRRSSSSAEKKDLGSIANMSDQERRTTHSDRLAQYKEK